MHSFTKTMTIRKRATRGNNEGEQRLKLHVSESNGNHHSAISKGKSSSSEPTSDSNDLTLSSLIPAVIICTLVSISSYINCDSITLAEDVIVATIRTFVQLSLLAALLSPLFRFVENHQNASKAANNGSNNILQRFSAQIVVLGYVLCFMLPLAAYEASSRSKLTLRPTIDGNTSKNTVFLIILAALFTSVSTMAIVAIFIIIKPNPRYSPRHVIPLCGMLFNNSLTSISLALDVLFTELQSKHRESIELMISFGTNSWTATRLAFRSALISALKPQINSMNVIGLVAIPGMLTGQVLGGSSITHAARYQTMIMYLIMGAAFVSVKITTEMVIWNAFDDTGALRDDWIVNNDSLRVSQLISSLWAISAWSQFNTAPQSSMDRVEAKMASEKIAVKLSMNATETTEEQPPVDKLGLFQVDIKGSYVMGNRIMNASFQFPANGTIAILKGESGVGKSTLLKTIAMLNTGFIPSSKSSMSLYGRNRDSFHPNKWRREVLYVPQNGALKLQGTPESFLEAVALSQNSALKYLRTETIKYMEEWNVHTKLSQPWMQLSGGEAQRILLAIAMSTEPTVLLLDEPTSACDLHAKLAVEKSLKAAAKNGCAIILVTHDEEQMNRLGTVWMSLDAK